MMKGRKNLTGQKFGRLTAIKLDEERTKRKSYWICSCECGNIKSVRQDSLTTSNPSYSIKSCGCLKKEQDKINLTANHSHKMSDTRLYKIWLGIKNRCNNPNSKRFEDWGGRGISICSEWGNDFNSFMNWAESTGYTDELTIDRIDNDGDYEPSNCRWATPQEQANNRRSNIKIEYLGESKTIKEWKEYLNLELSDATLYNRYARGDTGERLFREAQW